MARSIDGHIELLHALEQPRLGLGRCAVDLVDEDQVGEYRPRPKLEAAVALVEDVGPDQVRGQHVRGALDASELRLDARCQGARERRLADPGIVLDQDMPAREQGDQQIAQSRRRDGNRARDVHADTRA